MNKETTVAFAINALAAEAVTGTRTTQEVLEYLRDFGGTAEQCKGKTLWVFEGLHYRIEVLTQSCGNAPDRCILWKTLDW